MYFHLSINSPLKYNSLILTLSDSNTQFAPTLRFPVLSSDALIVKSRCSFVSNIPNTYFQSSDFKTAHPKKSKDI